MKYFQAKKLLEKHLGKSRFKQHGYNSALAGEKIAKAIKKKNPKAKLSVEKTKTMCLLHDIGKNEENRGICCIHALNGFFILKREGQWEIAWEILHHYPFAEEAEEIGLRGDFAPKTLEQKIMYYADMFAMPTGNQKTDVHGRLKELQERYKYNKPVLNAVKRSIKRVKAIEKELAKLIGISAKDLSKGKF